MNNNGYYQNPVFPGIDFNSNIPNQDSNSNFESMQNNFNSSNMEQTYIGNILKQNRGKKVKIYVTIPGSNEWLDKMFEGIIEGIGKDYIIISNPSNGEWNIIPMMFLDYITFEEAINFNRNF